METNALPDTLVECIRYFDEETSFNFVVNMRWSDGVVCPFCGGKEHSFLSTRKSWQCKTCNKQFSVKSGSIFGDSRLPLSTWIVAMWLIVNAKNGVSSYEIGRSIGVTQKTAWFLMHRIRHILQTGSVEKMDETVECDETYIGGKAKNMHYDKRKEKIKGSGVSGKEIVFGMIERGNGQKNEEGKRRRPQDCVYSQVRTMVLPDTKEDTIISTIEANVEKGSEVFTDSHKSYKSLKLKGYAHDFVDHNAYKYVKGRVYTNSIESYWNLLDRMIDGTYTHVSPEHLFRYTDELDFRFNYRGGTDLTRFLQAMKLIGGKHLSYDTLTTGHLKHMASKAA